MKQLNSHQFEKVYKSLKINLDTLGCIMLDLVPLKNMYSIEFEGAGVVLYYSKKKSRYWINGWIADKCPHITLLYGLLESGKKYEKYIEQVLKGWKLRTVEIEDISCFDSPYADEPYYCIVAKIKKTNKLIEGNNRLEFLPHINTFIGYIPHFTICYLKKSQGKAYRDTIIKQFKKLWIGKKLKVKGINLGDK